MYVCICNAYRDAEIREVARMGARSARKAYAALGGEPRCGRCLPVAQELIDREHGAPPAPAAPAVEPLGARAG